MRNLATFFAVALIVFGCATTPTFYIAVDSISAPHAASGKTYVLLPAIKGVKKDDLQFQEFATYVRGALRDKGFVEVTEPEKAKIAIYLAYGIGNPQVQQSTYSLPTWGQTGVSSSQTTGTVNVSGNTGTYSGTTTYTPTYGVTGYQSYSDTSTTYRRFMRLDAVDLGNRSSEKLKPVWRTTVTSTGSSDDLRRVFPVLVTAAEPYIATNTGEAVQVSLRENDPRIQKVKSLLKN